MKKPGNLNSLTASALTAAALGLNINAANLISNGGFEAGFSGWSRTDQIGSEGTFLSQTGTASPVNGEPVPPPPGGLAAAMSDAAGPGAHVLSQGFTLSAPVPSARLEFDLFVGNRADDFRAPDTLDFATPVLNQQARVDILVAGADPFSVAASDVLLNAFQTHPGDPLVSGYNHYSVDVTSLLNANLGVPLTLRFAESDNVFTLQLGVDNVAIEAGTAAVPDSAPGTLVFLTAAGLCWMGRRRIVQGV